MYPNTRSFVNKVKYISWHLFLERNVDFNELNMVETEIKNTHFLGSYHRHRNIV